MMRAGVRLRRWRSAIALAGRLHAKIVETLLVTLVFSVHGLRPRLGLGQALLLRDLEERRRSRWRGGVRGGGRLRVARFRRRGAIALLRGS